MNNPQKMTSVLTLTFLLSLGSLGAEDWPEWRGKGRLGVWTEEGILDRFPEGGLDVVWQTPIQGGYSGPAVADGRVYITDFELDPETRTMDGRERLLCLDEATGEVLWTHSWPVSYRSLMVSYATGPRATPTVEDGRVFAVGATGRLLALQAETGKILWEKDFVEDYGTSLPIWGISGAPLVDGEQLIVIAGGPQAHVVSFAKSTGKELWSSLETGSETGYAQPIIYSAGGARQLIIWHPEKMASLNPGTGDVYWEVPWEAPMGLTVATPVKANNYLFASQFYGGSMMLRLSSEEPRAALLWKRKGKDESPEESDSLHALITTPVVTAESIFGVGSYGQLRRLENRTGDRVWESLEMIELSRWAAAFIVRQGDRYFVNNDKGDLIIARFDESGYTEIDRTHLLKPTSNSVWGSRPGRPKPGDRLVNWSHPAYANGHIVARNDEMIIRASLKAEKVVRSQREVIGASAGASEHRN